ncbi:MAG: TraB/GumN family protein [Desulforhopalus sp.]|nr:TraB/GumN family protein [Desulforhopalus sp.]
MNTTDTVAEMPSSPFPAHQYGRDVHEVHCGDNTILLIGTAHISQDSVDLVTEVLTREEPDCVCLELDEKRYQAITQEKVWKELDLKTVIKNKQISALIVNLMMASYQKRLGGKTGVKPGAELLTAANIAREKNIQISLCDRDVRITLRRAWKCTPLWRKGWLLASLFAGIFEKEELSEKQLEEMRHKDVLDEMLSEMGSSLPELKKVLIDERDTYIVEKIKASPGKRFVAVVGAGHVAGMLKKFDQDNRDKLVEITAIPPISIGFKVAGWSIPLLIIGSIIAIGWREGMEAAGSNMLYWFLANGIPSAIGAALAFAHPLTILTAFLAAPFTSLTPVIGAGYVCAFTQVWLQPPVIHELETSSNDIATVRGWWKNRLLRIFLVFAFSSIGSLIGTWVGGIKIFKGLVG